MVSNNDNTNISIISRAKLLLKQTYFKVFAISIVFVLTVYMLFEIRKQISWWGIRYPNLNPYIPAIVSY